jgi:hypothetical protein
MSKKQTPKSEEKKPQFSNDEYLDLHGRKPTKDDVNNFIPGLGDALIEETPWQKAQLAERKMHNFGYAEGFVHYAQTYMNYFRFVGLGKDLHKLIVIEVGPADFPALAYCHNWKEAYCVEPMPSEHLERICKEKGIILYSSPFETLVSFNTEKEFEDHKVEVWFFNLLQHVEKPELIVQFAKSFADRIRFFEPINEPVTEYHLHKFDIKDYIEWFGDGCTVNLYAGGSVKNFHTADCAYGVWVKP